MYSCMSSPVSLLLMVFNRHPCPRIFEIVADAGMAEVGESQVASSAVSYYDKLSEWFMRLGVLCPRLSEWQSLFPQDVRLQRALDAFYATVIRFCTRAMQVLDRTGMRRTELPFGRRYLSCPAGHLSSPQTKPLLSPLFTPIVVPPGF